MNLDDFATNLNNLRIIPRVLVVGAAWFYASLTWDLTTWYMLLPTRTVEDTAFIVGLLTPLGGILKYMVDTYIKTGGANSE